MEPITTVGAGLAILGSKDILVKVLGPTADYIGGELEGFVQKCNINLDNIFVKAKNKLGPRLEEPGQVNSRVLKHVLDEGRFCEDELIAEYFGGILASSKTENGRDDRGVSIISGIKELSVYQIRLHYLFYFLVNQLLSGKGFNLGTDRKQMDIYIPYSVYLSAMDFSEDEDTGSILVHSVEGLIRHGLLEDQYLYGSKEHISKKYKKAPESGMILIPSVQGAEAFLWAHGVSGATGHELVNGSLRYNEPEVSIIEGAIAIKG